MKFFNKIQPKIQLPVIVMTVALLGLTLWMSTRTFQGFVQETLDKEVRVISRDIVNEVNMLKWLALEQIKAISFRSDMEEAVQNGNTEAVFKIIDAYTTDRKCEFFTILDADGNVIARTSERGRNGDSQLQLPCVQTALKEKKACVYFEQTERVRLCIRAASPILDRDGNLKGVVTGGFRFDTEEWVQYVKTTFQVESTTFVGDKRHVTTLINPETKKPAVGTPLTDPAVKTRIFEKKEPFPADGDVGESLVLGRRMRVFYLPIVSHDKDVLGILFIGMPVDRQTGLVWDNVLRNLSIAAIGIVLFSILLTLIVRRIVGPVHRMTDAAKDLADGNLEIGLDVQTGDELEVLAKAFLRVASSLKEKSAVALAIAGGDLTTWVPLSSEKDSLGDAFIKMRYGLYDSIKDLSSLARAVAEEGNNLTQTNDRLVANTTQSAMQLQEVAESIGILNSQTKENAGDSRNAETLSTQAKEGADQGRAKMQRMVQSMSAITKSSEEIKNIIRVIDDIAFQTNLLALNAAVEAARAGTHGKGFAVVAEEVRNLASRSAKAAKETAELIEESIRQVALGSQVADETAVSLNSITDIVEKVNGITTKISRDADSQTQRLDETNRAVGQVSETATQNTHVVTESCEAVGQLTSTAQKLDEITKHFKSNEGGKVSPPAGGNRGFIPK